MHLQEMQLLAQSQVIGIGAGKHMPMHTYKYDRHVLDHRCYKGPKYVHTWVYRVSMLGIVIQVMSRYLTVGYVDPIIYWAGV